MMQAKIDKASAHTLRHTFAVNYLKANPGDIASLSSLLGHESVYTTAIYYAQKKPQHDLGASVERNTILDDGC